MKRRIADILFAEVARQGVEHVFLLSGGGIMHLVDALGRSSLAYVCCRHEQAASIAAQAYAIHRNSLGVCLVTTGPGGTNALTGCAAAYMDSTPVLFLSGQVKRADFASKRDVRQFGAQENNIVAMARSVTKYAVLVEDERDALYELQKAVFLATSGRRGPVWVDVPLDVQSAEVEESTLRRFDSTMYFSPNAESDTFREGIAAVEPGLAARRALERLYAAERPLILIGHGLIAAGAEERFRVLTARLGVPVIATWRALGVLGHDETLFFGSPGLQAARYSNIIVQGADFLLVLGSRLDNMITAFAEERFALRAQKMLVDVDGRELRKFSMPGVTPMLCDVEKFLEHLEKAMPPHPVGGLEPWLAFCAEMKARFPISRVRQEHSSATADLYRVAEAIAANSVPEDTLVISSTSRCNTAGHIALPRKRGQKSISSMAFGSMGFALPSAVGAWFASKGRRVVVLEGDGSLELNSQELQTVTQHNINVKIFIFSNGGYAAIATMQDKNFSGFRVAADPGSGLVLPNLEKLAQAYGLPYTRIASDEEINAGVSGVMGMEGPVLCEVLGDMRFDEIPKCVSSLNAEGKRVSAALENPYPFLPEEELARIYGGMPTGKAT
jgi:acetolactate synthase-1/2/3 large subunit